MKLKKLLAGTVVCAQILCTMSTMVSANEVPAAPEAWGPTPNAGQMKYYKDELAGFVHFGVNQYTGEEWGNGKENPDIFQPSKLNTDQWIEAFQSAGIKRALLTTKHHDGFALFPTKYSPNKHSVESSSWRDGKGDVVQDFVNSCKKYNMGLGFYLSPWDQGNPYYDRNNPDGKDYNDIYIGQMEELMGYADKAGTKIVEFWMDGACGKPDMRPKYDIARWWSRLRQYDPNITFQQNYGAPLRWVGNEAGYANPVSSWQTFDYDYAWNLYAQQGKEDGTYLHNGEPYIKGQQTQHGKDMEHMIWSIPEVDVSITNGWFGNGGTNAPKSPEELAEIYFNSVGRGSPLLLNVPPNKDGLFDARYVQTLKEFGDILSNTFDVNVAAKATAVATSVRGNHNRYGAGNTTDGDYDTYWTMNDGQTTGSVTVDLKDPTLIDVIEVQEYIPLGQRVSKFTVEVNLGTKESPKWQVYGSAGTIGYKRLIKGAPVTASQIRLTVNEAYAVPLINNIAAYKADDRIALEAKCAPGKIEAESFDSKSGSVFAEEKLPGVGNLGGIHNGDYTVYKGVDFRQLPAAVNLSYAGEGTPEITIRLDSVDGPVIARKTVAPTGSYTTYKTVKMDVVSNPDIELGVHDVYLCLNAGVNVDSFEFLGQNVVEFADATLKAYEGNKALLTVKRSEESLNTEVTVQIETSPGTAVHGRHYIDKIATITFAPGEAQKTVEIETVDNQEQTGPLDFFVSLKKPSANAYIGKQATVKVVIEDNEQPGNPAELKALVETANRKLEADYMPESWTAFRKTLEDAKSLLTNAEAQQKQLDEMTARLQKAMDDLRPLRYTEDYPFQLSATAKVDVEAEYMCLGGGARVTSREGDSNGKEVEEMGLSHQGVEGYVEFYFYAPAAGTYNFHMRYFTGAPNTLKWVMNDGTDVQSKALNYTNQGKGHFEEDDLEIVVKKAGLNKIKFYNNEATTCNLDKFTITPVDVEVVKPADKTQLKQNIAQAETMIPNKDQYVQENWQQLVDALAQAKKVMADESAKEEAVKAAADTLSNAISAQRLKADKSALKDLVSKAEGMNLDGYTAESAEAFRNALKAAQTVLANENLSKDDQAVVDEAVAKLAAAIDGLTAEPAPNPNPNPDPEPEKPEPEKPEKPEPEKPEPPKTGDNSHMMIAAAAAFTALAGATCAAVALFNSNKRRHI